MPAADCLSMARVAGLMASVGSDCHFEEWGIGICCARYARSTACYRPRRVNR